MILGLPSRASAFNTRGSPRALNNRCRRQLCSLAVKMTYCFAFLLVMIMPLLPSRVAATNDYRNSKFLSLRRSITTRSSVPSRLVGYCRGLRLMFGPSTCISVREGCGCWLWRRYLWVDGPWSWVMIAFARTLQFGCFFIIAWRWPLCGGHVGIVPLAGYCWRSPTMVNLGNIRIGTHAGNSDLHHSC